MGFRGWLAQTYTVNHGSRTLRGAPTFTFQVYFVWFACSTTPLAPLTPSPPRPLLKFLDPPMPSKVYKVMREKKEGEYEEESKPFEQLNRCNEPFSGDFQRNSEVGSIFPPRN